MSSSSPLLSRCLRLAVLLACLGAASTPALAGPIDADTLARLEDELSIPICGVGYLETRMGQLEALGIDEPVAYLDRIARGDYPDGPDDDRARAWLPSLAVELLAQLATDGDRAAHEALRALYDERTAPEHAAQRLLVAQRLAGTLGDDHGRALLVAHLADPSVQVRADTFTALLPIADEALAAELARLALDADSYVVGRVIWDLDGQDTARALLLDALDTLERDGALDAPALGQLAVVRVGIAGDDDDAVSKRAEAFLAHYAGASDEATLDELASLSQALVLRGEALGLRGALRLAELHGEAAGAKHHSSASNQAVMVFAQLTPFELDEALLHDHTAQARALAEWFAAHGTALRFDPKTRHWTL